MKKILVVLTNTTTYGDRNDATGLWLGEAAEFVDEVDKKGYEVDYISPKGGYVPVDPRSMKYADAATFAMYATKDFQNRALANSLKPSEIKPDDYAAIYYTGGHGVMWDFPNNQELDQISLTIYKNGGYVTSVCHGIAGLLFIKNEAGNYLVENKNITGFTTIEEYLSGKRSSVPFFNEKIAKEHGARFHKKRAFSSYALQDGQLITGQNPQSARAVARKLLSNFE